MQIRFDSLKEIKDFILMVDIYQLCEKEEAWGGAGVIITDDDRSNDEKGCVKVTETWQSKVSPPGGDLVIVTPYYRQISWLFRTLFQFSRDKPHKLNPGTLMSGFRIGCEGYFIINPNHAAKELMLFIIDGMIRLMEAHRGGENKEE